MIQKEHFATWKLVSKAHREINCKPKFGNGKKKKKIIGTYTEEVGFTTTASHSLESLGVADTAESDTLVPDLISVCSVKKMLKKKSKFAPKLNQMSAKNKNDETEPCENKRDRSNSNGQFDWHRRIDNFRSKHRSGNACTGRTSCTISQSPLSYH